MNNETATMNPNVFEEAAIALGRVTDLSKRSSEVLDRVASAEAAISTFADVVKSTNDETRKSINDAAQSVKLVHTDILSLRQELANINREFGAAFVKIGEVIKESNDTVERLVLAQSQQLAEKVASLDSRVRHSRTLFLVLWLMTWATYVLLEISK